MTTTQNVVRVQTTPYVVQPSDDVLLAVPQPTSAVAIQLPDATTSSGREITISNTGQGEVSVTGIGGIYGRPSLNLYPGQGATFISDGTTWTPSTTVGTGGGGPPGATGPAGTPGAAGPQGPQGPAGPSVWGGITGSLSSQTDLQNALNGKTPLISDTGAWQANHAYTAGQAFTSPYNTVRLVLTGYTSGSSYGTSDTGSNTRFLGQQGVPQGTLASRPTAGIEGGAPFRYKATDVSGGTTYDSDGTAWTASAAGVNSTAGVELAYQETTTNPATTSTTPVDVTGLTGITFTTPSSGKVIIIGHVEGYDNTVNDGVLLTIVDSNSGTEYARARNSGGPANTIEEMHAQRRWVLTPNTSYTIKMQTQALGGGTANFVTSASNPSIVAYVQVLSC